MHRAKAANAHTPKTHAVVVLTHRRSSGAATVCPPNKEAAGTRTQRRMMIAES
jgi:hypothetical protein